MRDTRCGVLRTEDVGKTVKLVGWCHKQRDLGSLVFMDLRDLTGIVQVVADEDSPASVKKTAASVRGEYVVRVEGRVRLRTSPNPDMLTGLIEVLASDMEVLSVSETPPFYIEEDSEANESLRLKYRYLDLRRPDMQRKMILRHRLTKATRDYFDSRDFLEIETPMLTKSTPEGARDYLVPSRVHPGKFFALPQSPQIFKQLLMLSGYDRYMQIARCFRDEDLRADRQPEFTQIDLEMSFVDIDDILEINEGFIAHVFKEVLDVDVALPIKRMDYAQAMERFGSDKPDTGFGMELVDISDIAATIDFMPFKNSLADKGSVRCLKCEGGASLSRKQIDRLTEYVKTYRAKGLAWITCDEEPRGSILKFLEKDHLDAIYARTEAKAGDIIFIVSDSNDVVFDALGHLRLQLAEDFSLTKKGRFDFLWVTDFPLLEYDEEEERYVAKHHPFTSPLDEDLALLDSSPEKVRAKAYDLILNGTELGGGSIRIHSQDLQKKMFSLLGFTEEEAMERFGFLLNAFKYGVPPHGGIAFGLDRLAMLMTDSDSIRDVIAFPKVQTSACLMTEAPGSVDARQLDELHLKLEDIQA